MSREIWLCHTQMKMSLDDIKRIVLNGFKSAFLPFHQKQALMRSTTRELKRFHGDGTITPIGDEGTPDVSENASL